MKQISFFLFLTFACQAQNINQIFQTAYAQTLEHNYQAALELYNKIDDTLPNTPEVLCNIGFCLNRLNKPHSAIEYYEKAKALHPEPQAHIERALSHAYLTIGNFEKGWKAYEYRWKTPPIYNEDLKRYITNGGTLHNKKIIINTEYGYGDVFQFIRYAQALKSMGAYIMVVCHKPELIPLLKLCPYIDIIAPPDQTLPHADFQALTMSLPYILSTTLKTIPAPIPYLFADQQRTQKWKEQLAQDKNLKIGVCWQADMHINSHDTSVQTDAQKKSIPLELLAQLSVIPNMSLYSLQKSISETERRHLSDHYKITFFENVDKGAAFMDTAAIIQNVDLIITIDTSIAHLAGALGKPVITLLPYNCDWRWMLDTSNSGWYPTMELIRQPQAGDWQSLIKQIAHKIIHYNNQKHATQLDVYRLYSAGIDLINNDHLDDARFILELLISLDQSHADAYYTYGYILSRINESEKATHAYQQALTLNPQHHLAKLGLSKAFLAMGNYEQAWPLFEDRFPNPEELQKAYGYLHVTPDQISGKIVLLHAEWGLGDMIHFVRYADLLRKAGARKIIVQTFEQLVPLFSICPLIDQTISIGDPLPHADIHIPTLSLPLIFKTTIDTIPAPIPYIKADPQLVALWKEYISHDKNIKIGLCWHTKPIYLEDHKHTRRSIPLSLFDELANSENVSFYSLQKVHGVEEITNLKHLHLKELPSDFDNSHGRFMDSAALIMNLDLIITADTSICHLAGALGKQVWLIVPYCPEWRWLPGHAIYKSSGTTPWYPTNMRLFYQKKPGDFISVIAEIKSALIEFAKRNYHVQPCCTQI